MATMNLDGAWLDQAIEIAQLAADAAEEVVRKYYRADLSVEIKADASPVTMADREAESAIVSVLRAAFPDHAFYGEEHGHSGNSDFLWLIDPIDGTKAFVREYPLFSTQIALMYRGELVLGVSSAGQFGQRAHARLGGGAFLNDEPIRIVERERFADAQLSIGNVKTLTRNAAAWARVGQLINGMNRTRGYGDFLHYHWLAAGKVDVVIESDVNILDIAALAVIAREAGAVFTELDGGPLTLDTRTVLAATPKLHQAVLDWFAVLDR